MSIQDGKLTPNLYKMLYIHNSAEEDQSLRPSRGWNQLPPAESRARIPEECIGISQTSQVSQRHAPQDTYHTRTPQQQTDDAIDDVMRMTGCDFDEATDALRLKQGDVLDAIFYIQRV